MVLTASLGRSLGWFLLASCRGCAAPRRQSASRAHALWWWLWPLTASVLWPAVVLLPCRSCRRATLQAGARLFFRLTGSQLSVQTSAPPPSGLFVLVANHASYLHAAVLSAIDSRGLAFVAKQELAEQALVGLFLRRLGTAYRPPDPIRRGGVAEHVGRRVQRSPRG